MMATHARTAVDGSGKMLHSKLARLLEDWEQNVAALRRVVLLVNGSNGDRLANASRSILADALALDRTRAARHNGNGNGNGNGTETTSSSDGNADEPTKDRKARVRAALAALPDVVMSTVELRERGIRGIGPLVRNGFLKKTQKGYRPTARAKEATGSEEAALS